MTKVILAVAIAGFAIVEARAQFQLRAIECTEYGLTDLWNDIDTISDSQRRAYAMKGWARAIAMLDKGDVAACRMQMQSAYQIYDNTNAYRMRS